MTRIGYRTDKYAKVQFLHLRMLYMTILTVALILLASVQAKAGRPVDAPSKTVTDTVRQLQEFEVRAEGRPGALLTDSRGTITLGRSDLSCDVRVGGFTDAINTLSRLPGFSSVSDYGSGVSANGANYNQIAYTYAGAPVFFPYHFGGLFSTFNTSHISRLKANKAVSGPSMSDRLGGCVTVEPPTAMPDSITATAEVGMLASSVAARFPFGLAVSGRISYINQLYPWLLKSDGYVLGYDLADFNVTYANRFSRDNLVDINVLGSFDKLKCDDSASNMGLSWRNLVASLHYAHGELVDVTAYFSHFAGTLSCEMPQMSISAPSYMSQGGVFAEVRPLSYLSVGWRTELTMSKPQSPRFGGLLAGSLKPAGTSADKSMYNKLYAQYRGEFRNNMTLEATASLGLFRKYWLPSGSVTYTLRPQDHSISFTADYSTQHLFQVGMSDMGMASNFWMQAGQDLKPAKAFGLDVVADSHWLDGLVVTTLEAYCKRVLDEPEYSGGILDLVSANYSASARISSYSGYNVGASALARFNTHPVSGWIGVDAGWSRRRYDDGQWHSSPYEPLFSLNMQASWRISRMVSVSGVFTASSGRAYTGIDALYIIAGNVITQYGEKNGSRMPTYHRLDLSANFFFRPFRIGRRLANHFANISMLNVYGHRNVELQYYKYNPENNEIYLKRVSSLYRFMPSVSYTVEL